MSKHANPTLIGSFVVGAVALTVAGILLFGGGGLFVDDLRVVTHFQESITGLEPGSPVRFRGVQMGRVSSISAVWDKDAENVVIPVELSISRDRIQTPEGETPKDFDDPYSFLSHAVQELGLRTELTVDSFVTSKLYVSLDFRPDTPADLMGGTELLEIPSIQGEFAAIKQSLKDVPLGDLTQNVMNTLSDIRRVISDPRVIGLIESTKELVDNLNEHVDPLAAASVATLDEVRALAATANEELGPLSAEARALLASANEKLVPLVESADELANQLRTTVSRVDGILAEDRTMLFQLADMLEQVAGAARSVRLLADYLERHPEALLSGKEGS